MNWDIVSSMVAICTALGGMLVVWWKVKTDNEELRKQINDHDKKIMVLITDKASISDLVKLTELVDKIDQRVLAHHEDTRKHRTEDFDSRIKELIKTVEDFARENRDAHDKIIALIGK